MALSLNALLPVITDFTLEITLIYLCSILLHPHFFVVFLDLGGIEELEDPKLSNIIYSFMMDTKRMNIML